MLKSKSEDGMDGTKKAATIGLQEFEVIIKMSLKM